MPPVSQWIGDRLIEAQPAQDVARPLFGILGPVDVAEWPPRAGQRTWNMAIAVDPTDLFDHVLGQRAIQPKIRRRDRELGFAQFEPEFQAFQDVLHLWRRHLDT